MSNDEERLAQKIFELEERILRIIKGEVQPEPLPQLSEEEREITSFLFNLEGTMYAGKGHSMSIHLQKLYYSIFTLLNELSPWQSFESEGGGLNLPQKGTYTFHLVTGRSESYVEAFSLNTHMRFLGPNLVENGAVICIFSKENERKDKRLVLVDESDSQWKKEVYAIIQEAIGPESNIQDLMEPEKKYILTVNLDNEKHMSRIESALLQYNQKSEEKNRISWARTLTGFDICPINISRLTGTRRLVELIGRDLKKDCAYFGDAPSDIEILQNVAIPVVPYSAHPEVKRVARKKGIVAELPHGYGTLQGLLRIVEHNLYSRLAAGYRRADINLERPLELERGL